MKLYVIRHGSTNENINNIVIGRIDVEMCTEGIKSVYELKDTLKDVKFDIAFSSPLIRTVNTTNILLENDNCAIICDDRLLERDFGRYEGHPSLEEGKKVYWEYDYLEDDLETFDEVYERVESFISDLRRDYKDTNVNILIVTHATVTVAFEDILNRQKSKKKLNDLVLKHANVRVYDL